MAILDHISIFFSFSWMIVIVSAQLRTFPVPSGGSESIVFAPNGGFYVGVNDGRILRYGSSRAGWINFAYASPNRTSSLCDGTTDLELGSICGRTLGLGYHYATNQLYMADAYHGLCVVGHKGGLATQLVNIAGGQPLKWLDGLEVDQNTGNVYFTDISTIYNLSQLQENIGTGDSTGRLIEYNPTTKSARVLVSGLEAPGGIGVNNDSSFLLFSEFSGNKISKYWLKGPKANMKELVMNVTSPANIKKTESGEYWVATGIQSPTNMTTGIRINENGTILETITFGAPYNNTPITEVHKHCGKLYIANFYAVFIGVYKLPGQNS